MFQKYHAQAQDSNTIGTVWLRKFFYISHRRQILNFAEFRIASKPCLALPSQTKKPRREEFIFVQGRLVV
jgi:hypothetical protein